MPCDYPSGARSNLDTGFCRLDSKSPPAVDLENSRRNQFRPEESVNARNLFYNNKLEEGFDMI